MFFNSWGYLLFLLSGICIYWLLPNTRWRVYFLGVFSILFYSMWRWEFSLLMLFSICVGYVAAMKIHGSSSKSERMAWLLINLIVNIALLVFFKYTYFLYDNLSFMASGAGFHIASLADLSVTIILPLGISFYTFHIISYSVDVYRGVIRPASSFPLFLTYVTFWPQLIAGPILRAGEVIPQLERERTFSWDDTSVGLLLIISGFFKKIVIADNLSPMVDFWFASDSATLTAIDVWVANFLFGFQIYCDFSGYSDIAIGSALMVGLHFPDNFNWPYIARSPKDFWKRWHISLSSWVRDYLYLPLTGQAFRTDSTGGIGVAAETQRKSHANALLLTWLIMGLWHGAKWTFVLWGLYHACLILVYRVSGFLERLPKRAPLLAWIVMLFFIMAGWIPFRANSFSQAIELFGKIVNPLEYRISHRILGMESSFAAFSYLWAAVITMGMGLAFLAHRYATNRVFPKYMSIPAQALLIAIMVYLILMNMRVVQQFIYFQF